MILPDSVRFIGKSAFADCNALKKINIPKNVTMIEDSVFGHCYGLTEIAIPDGVKAIGSSDAFYRCKGLTSVTVPDSVKYIGEKTFVCDSLKSVILPKNIKYVCSRAIYAEETVTVFYKSTAEDWQNVFTDNEENTLDFAELCYYSETRPSGEGSFWHFVNGMPVKW